MNGEEGREAAVRVSGEFPVSPREALARSEAEAEAEAKAMAVAVLEGEQGKEEAPRRTYSWEGAE